MTGFMAASQKRDRDDDGKEVSRHGPASLSRPISPPAKRQKSSNVHSSPWQLTWIRDLPDDCNRDAVTLNDLLGDPLIAECWDFNYLHDIEFLMDAFDPDVRHLVNVHVVHGFWKQEDQNRLMLAEAANFSNVQCHTAFMPEVFGTHHSKMMILFRHDGTAQVIIHTANMIAKDWTNMTNAVWSSPLLPLLSNAKQSKSLESQDRGDHKVGGGERFKVDLLAYLREYNRRRPVCKNLVDKLCQYDFSAIKAVLVASVPGRHNAFDQSETPWGHTALKRYLKEIPCSAGRSEIVVQVSSIATLGAKDEWLQKTLFDSMNSSGDSIASRPLFRVVFPTADEIRKSLDGYASGASIHTKIQSAQQAKQLLYLRPILHHWGNDSPGGKGLEFLAPSPSTALTPLGLPVAATHKDSGRKRAAPHVKTYVRYNDKGSIDWAMLTSANLSKQAWGETASPNGDVRIASWEIGVLVWPGVLQEHADMVGTFKSDVPDAPTVDEFAAEGRCVVGVRIPYNMPLQRYGEDEVPWVTTLSHSEADCKGKTWGM